MKKKLLLFATSFILASGFSCFALAKKPKPSGIYGRITQIGFPPNHSSMGQTMPLPGETVGVFDKNGDEVARAVGGKYGKFKISLPPGTYKVEPIPPDPDPLGMGGCNTSKVTVTVWRGFYTGTYAQYDCGW